MSNTSSLGFTSEYLSSTVNAYRPVFIPVYLKNQSTLFLAIRSFENANNQTQFLIVNSDTLETKIMPADHLYYRNPIKEKENGYIRESEVNATRYLRKLIAYTQPPYLSANQGLTHAKHSLPKTAYLSVDLCPSVRPFEKTFFERLIALQSAHSPQPIPVAISISGLWLLGHPKEFSWLVQQKKEKHLAITWVNHSYSHIYYPDVPLDKNLLTLPGTDITNEFLGVERLLIMRGQVPSVFVRMPGLVSDQAVILQARKLGLIPLGANAWLFHGQPIKDGSIVLVHGNGNESGGVELILPQLSQWHWLDLRGAV